MKIRLSPTATLRLMFLLQRFEDEWSEKVRLSFELEFDAALKRIAEQPYSCQKFLFPDVFRCVVSAHTSFFYRVATDTIEVITLVDNRQNPNDIHDELKKLL